jgi:hypothetical protein
MRSPVEPRCAGQPFVSSVAARGVGDNVSGFTNGSAWGGGGGRNPALARRAAVSVSDARGSAVAALGRAATGRRAGSDGCSFFASEAVGVGSNRAGSVSVRQQVGTGRAGLRTVWSAGEGEFAAVGGGRRRTRSSRVGPPCLVVTLSPLELGSCAVGVGSIVVSGVWLRPAEQEQPFSAVRRADVGGANAAPDRVIPCLGQVAEYAVESPVFQRRAATFSTTRRLGRRRRRAATMSLHSPLRSQFSMPARLPAAEMSWHGNPAVPAPVFGRCGAVACSRRPAPRHGRLAARVRRS